MKIIMSFLCVIGFGVLCGSIAVGSITGFMFGFIAFCAGGRYVDSY